MALTTSFASYFSNTYHEARAKFSQTASSAGLSVRSYVHPLEGLSGETLAVDCALLGKADSEKLFILSSGCHGVEGYCGSGVQTYSLHDRELHERALAADISILYVHALNPHGFSFGRRVTEDNVDLNRNFHDFARPLPVNEGYREVHSLVLPAQWPPDAQNQAAIAALIQARGYAAVQSAVSGGQYEFPGGLFFGGVAPTWSNLTLRQILRDYTRHTRKLGWIDIHTGLGPSGHGERIFAQCANAHSEYERAASWWAGAGHTPVTRADLGESASTVLSGTTNTVVSTECSNAEATKIVLEFGTQPPLAVLEALRADHWLHNHPHTPSALAHRIRQQLRDVFFVDTDLWKQQVIAQGQEAIHQCVTGMAC
ncbi:MAG: M14 family metallopeptidase [Casimicrobium sp.]